MKTEDADSHLVRHLSGEAAPEALCRRLLEDSSEEFVRAYRRRQVWRRATQAAAAVLIVAAAFWGGRLSVSDNASEDRYDPGWTRTTSGGIHVPNEMVEWLAAARLFEQLQMPDRTARALERASRLAPPQAVFAENRNLPALDAAAMIDRTQDCAEPAGIQGPNPSAQSIQKILAEAFLGD